MQQDNNIENKLREMEGIEQPDLSQMDNHWQQMAAVLQPSVLPVKKGWPKWMLNTLSIAAVVVLIIAASLYLTSEKGDKKKSAITENETSGTTLKEDLNNNIDAPLTTDSSIKETGTTLHTSKINPSLIYQYESQGNGDRKDWTENDSLLGTLKLNYTPCETCPGKEVDVLSNAERKLRLTTLFTQLEKQEQHFSIDNSRDTLLQFEEGTVLLIPANSFGGMNSVELTGKEFYKTSDIVLNQLNTVSNKEQLETGGMLHLTASYKGNKVNVSKEIPITLFLPDTEKDMNDMQLFLGVQHAQQNAIPVVQLNDDNEITKSTFANSINWIGRPQYFLKRRIITEARVLNIIDQPYSVKKSANGSVGYFMVGDNLAVEKDELKKLLRKKYGYHTVILRSNVRDRFKDVPGDGRDFDRDYAERIGDSLWMDKKIAEQYGLNTSVTRTRVIDEVQPAVSKTVKAQTSLLPRDTSSLLRRRQQSANTASDNTEIVKYVPSQMLMPARDSLVFTPVMDVAAAARTIAIPKEIKSKYSVNLSELGWINCDRFYADNRKKINYKVDLGDTATNYYTMLVFENMRSMMTGYIDDNKVVFQNIPVGEPVKIISIGINKQGETVYSVTHTTTSERELKGLQFQTTSASELKASLSKLDN